MFQRRDFSHLIQAGGRGCSTALAAWLLFGGVAAAQDSRSAASNPVSPIPAATPTPLNLVFTLPSSVEQPDAQPTLVVPGGKAGRLALPRYFADLPASVRRITLQQAQQMAAAATNPLVASRAAAGGGRGAASAWREVQLLSERRHAGIRPSPEYVSR